MTVPTLAGLCSTVLFALGTLPMLVRAWRTKDLRSYSRGQLALANAGNLVHSVYVLSLPAGPLWGLHGFYLVTTGLMLWWHVRHVPAERRSVLAAGPFDPGGQPAQVGRDGP